LGIVLSAVRIICRLYPKLKIVTYKFSLYLPIWAVTFLEREMSIRVYLLKYVRNKKAIQAKYTNFCDVITD